MLPLITLFFGSFCLGTAEFMATGLLPQIAADTGISIPTAGLIVTSYALGVAIGGPILGIALDRMPRKLVLIGLLSLFALAQIVCAVSPSFELLLAGRVIGAACQGAFFGIAGLVAVSIAGEAKAGMALSMMVAGITVANILGLPGGTLIGHAVGWRASFVTLGLVAATVTLLIALFVPAPTGRAAAKAPMVKQLRAIVQTDVLLAYAVMTLASIGFFAVFTYITPLLSTVTRIDASAVTMLQLAFGIGSTAGALLGGLLADWRPTPVLIAILGAEILVFAVIALGATQPGLMAVAVTVLGFCAFGYAPSLFVRLFQAAGDAPDLASTLISTAFNVGIASGAAIGGALLAAGASYAQLPLVGIVTASLAVGVVLTMVARSQNRIPDGLPA